MKKIQHKNFFNKVKHHGILAVVGGLILVSCGTQMGGYSETDGVYYDPNKDTLPEGTIMDQGNRVGEYYDYQDSGSIIRNSEENMQAQNSKYDQWNTESDWGAYTGTETNFYNDYWGYPYGFGYSPWSWSIGFSMGYSWGWSPWSWYGYNPYWYNPYWGYYGSYYPSYYYGYNPYFGYSPYYGYGSYYGYGPLFRTKRSGADGRLYNSYSQGGLNKQGFSNGFRNSNSIIRNSNANTIRYRNPQRNPAQMDAQGVRPRYQNVPQNNGVRPTQQPPRMNQPRMRDYQSTPRPQQSQPRYDSRPRSNDNGGFRSGSSGSFNSGSSGTRSGSSSGTRSGGFR